MLVPSGALSTADHEHGIAAWTDGRSGRQGDPRTSNSSLYLYRYPAGRDFEMSRFFAMLSQGAMTLQHVAQAAGPGAGELIADGFVEVRGRQAEFSEHHDADGPEGKMAIRMISWIDLHPNGRQVTFILWSDPMVYSMDEVVAWANSLREA